MSHFILKCSVCSRTITQCRCPDINKEVKYSICDACKSVPAPPPERLAGEGDPTGGRI